MPVLDRALVAGECGGRRLGDVAPGIEMVEVEADAPHSGAAVTIFEAAHHGNLAVRWARTSTTNGFSGVAGLRSLAS
jgi:hypothetical protein